jgi:enoyl-[acyl-carrier protein] reductase I
MGLFTGKKGIIMGVVNEYSIAAGIAKTLAEHGATIGFSHLPDKDGRDRMAKRVQRVAEPLGVSFIRPCDVAVDEDVTRFFAEVREHFGTIDFLVHSIAFAPLDDIRCPTLDATREGFRVAMDISVYSFIAVAREASKLMEAGSSMVTLSYFGGEKVVGGYNMMGVCKSALEMTTRYLAHDLGPRHIRVNAVSSGPIRTLAASAVGDFSDMLGLNAAVAPMGRNVSTEEVGKAAAYLLSDLSSATTGEILHVDCGYHIMGSPGHAVKRLTGMEAHPQ